MRKNDFSSTNFVVFEEFSSEWVTKLTIICYIVFYRKFVLHFNSFNTFSIHQERVSTMLAARGVTEAVQSHYQNARSWLMAILVQ